MDNKFYVSFEAARVLKEKGYNEDCEQIIKEDGEILYGYNVNYKLPVTLFSCPTKAEVIDWLESKGITIEVHRYRYDDCDNNKVYRYYILEAHIVDEPFSTRLKAEEAAIIKALELL